MKAAKKHIHHKRKRKQHREIHSPKKGHVTFAPRYDLSTTKREKIVEVTADRLFSDVEGSFQTADVPIPISIQSDNKRYTPKTGLVDDSVSQMSYRFHGISFRVIAIVVVLLTVVGLISYYAGMENGSISAAEGVQTESPTVAGVFAAPSPLYENPSPVVF
eukprot:snap_masked-scaffold_2-processed-gene-13.27-mRNA-1 protein AED:1.00 eAED:1.00 QI:0/-1/0/0/-1/1/1/0/160